MKTILLCVAIFTLIRVQAFADQPGLAFAGASMPNPNFPNSNNNPASVNSNPASVNNNHVAVNNNPALANPYVVQSSPLNSAGVYNPSSNFQLTGHPYVPERNFNLPSNNPANLPPTFQTKAQQALPALQISEQVSRNQENLPEKYVSYVPLSLTTQDPLAVLETPPTELLQAEPHILQDYPNHLAIHVPVIPALNLQIPNFNSGLYSYEAPAIAECIDRNCFCPMVYNPVCGFDSDYGVRVSSDRGFRVFSNSCSFSCAKYCNRFLTFAYCGECDPAIEALQPKLPRPSLNCLNEVFQPPAAPAEVYVEPVSTRRHSR